MACCVFFAGIVAISLILKRCFFGKEIGNKDVLQWRLKRVDNRD